MQRAAVVVIGAGQAGLAVSQLLTAASVDHVVLERGRAAERWRSQRWDSLRMLTPNWMSRLPGWSYRGPAPTGYMRAAEVAGLSRRVRRVVRCTGRARRRRTVRPRRRGAAISSPAMAVAGWPTPS